MLSAKKFPAGTSPHFSLETEEELSKQQCTHQLVYLFVSALSESSNESIPWQSLLTYLKSLSKDDLDSLEDQPEIQHYLHRAVHRVAKSSGEFERPDVFKELSILFPDAVKMYAQTELPCSYSYSDVKHLKAANDKRKGITHKRAATTPLELFAYTPKDIPATFRGTQVRVADLTPASYQVNDVISAAERKVNLAQFGGGGEVHCDVARLGRPHLSQRLKLKRSRSLERAVLLQASADRPLMNPVLSSSVDDSHFHKLTTKTLFPRSTSPIKGAASVHAVSTPDQLKLTDAYQAIEAFASGKLKSESESVYLNYSDQWRYNPYSLVVVPKTRTDPEHFVISKFGIVCMYPDGTSTLQSFAEWLREASLYQMMRQITFFKYYRVKKAFYQWHQTVRFDHFACVQSKVNQVGIRYFTTFSEAILKINHLSQELLSIPFHSLQPLGAYTRDSYMHCLKGSQTKFRQFLQRYFKYCRRIVVEVVESTQSQAVELDNELRHQPFVSDLPLSVQKENQQKLARDFEEMSYRSSRLSDFVCLAEHIVFSCILAAAHQGAQEWISTTIGEVKDEGSDSWDSYSDSLSNATLSDSSVAMDRYRSNFSTIPHQSWPTTDGGARAILCVSIVIKETGEICTEPSAEEVKRLLLCPLHMMSESLVDCVQPLTGLEQKPGSQLSRPLSQASTLPTATEVHSTGLEDGTPLHTQGSPQKNTSPRGATKLRAGRARRPVPPSMVPARQPKSILKALKGNIVGPSAELEGGKGDDDSELLESERARSQLANITTGTDAGALRSSVGSTNLLLRDSFTSTVKEDEVLLSMTGKLQRAIDRACETIRSTCDDNQWIGDVWKFVSSWPGRSKVTSMSSDELERTFNSLYDWQCLLESLPVHKPTPHSLVSVGSSEVVGKLLPRLTAILEQIKSVGVLQAKLLCERVLNETKQKTELLTSKRYDLEGFAEYAHNLNDCQTFHRTEAKHIDYVLRVHGTLRRNGVKVPRTDEALSEELREVWTTFEGVLCEAEQFVKTQTPVKAQGLQQSIESYEEELNKFVQQINEGKFVDPGENPLQLLEELGQVLEEAYSVRSRLVGLSKWKEAINGEPHDLSRVFRLMEQIVTRQEVWKYRKVFDGYERDWLKVPFKKLDIGILSEKVTAWLEVCSKLEESLPAMDPVLVGWKERLWEFQRGIPLLQQLASKALKVSHWFTIFASLGEDYEPSRQYTLNDFQLFEIYDHSDIIFEICHDAMQQEKLRAKVDSIQSRLEQDTIAVSQCPVDRYPFAVTSSTPQDAEPLSKATGLPSVATTSNATSSGKMVKDVSSPTKKVKHGDRMTSFVVGFQSLHSSDGGHVECLFFVENEEKILIELENDIIGVKILLSSPHLGSLRPRAESVMKTLMQLRELVGSLYHCQEQWRQLLSLFTSIDPQQRPSYGLSDLQQATAKFQDVVQSIRDDPRLLSLLGKRRGQKGFRELQGDSLRQCFDKIQTNMEAVHCMIKRRLEIGCEEFPRLCFLTESDVVKVVSHRGSPVAIAPLISRVFPAVKTIRFGELLPSNSVVHQPTHDSKEGFQLMGVEGWYGEQLQLVASLPLGKRPAPQWLRAMESALAYSLGSALAECHSAFPEALMGLGHADQQGDDIDQWVSSSLSQLVVLSLEMKWTMDLYSALTNDNPTQQLRHITSRLHAALDSTADLLRSEREHDSVIKCQISLQNIVMVLSHKLEVAKCLIDKSAVNPAESFEWRQHVLYAPEPNTIYNSVQKEPSQQNNRLSIDYNRLNQTGFRGSTTSVYSSLHSLKAGSSNALITNAKLQGSTHSLVASSKSLLHSRNALLAAAAIGSDMQNSGTSSLVLHKEPPQPMRCFVHCGESILSYGFEYQSPKAKLVLSPLSESCVLSLINEVARFSLPSLSGAGLSGKTETTFEVARLLGRHCYQFICSPSNTLSSLRHLITGALQSGSLLLLQDSGILQPHVLASLGAWLASLVAAVAKAFSGKHSSIIFPVHSQNLPDSETSTFSTPRQSRTCMSTVAQPHSDDKAGKTSSLKNATSRQLSVIISEQQLLTESPSSRQPTAMAPRAAHKDDLDHTRREKPPTNISSVGASPSQCSNLSQHSLGRNQQHLTATTSRTTTRIDWYKLGEEQPNESRSTLSKTDQWYGYGGGPRVSIELSNQLFQASPGFGCMFVSSSCITTVKEIPESFKSALRPMCVITPDCARIGEALLLSHGFTEATTLSRKLAKLLNTLVCQLRSSNKEVASCTSSTASLRRIISRSFNILTSKGPSDSADILQRESSAVAQAVIYHFSCQLMCEEAEEFEEFEGHISVDLDPVNWKRLKEIVRVYFPESDITIDKGKLPDSSTELTEAIKTQLKEHHLQPLPPFEEKICQLHRSLQHSKCIVISGVSGSGKTTCYRSLAGAYHHIRELRALGKQSQNVNKNAPHSRGHGDSSARSGNDYPCVDITVINPAVYSYEELFGSYHRKLEEEEPASWRDGVLTRVIKKMTNVENMKMKMKHPDGDSTPNTKQVPADVDEVNHWLVLDGPLKPGVVAALEVLAKGEGLTLANGDTLILPRSCWLLVETTRLTHMTPSLLSNSILIHFSRDILTYESIVNTWLDSAPTQHNLSAMSTETLATMIKQLLPESLLYLQETNTRCIGALYSSWTDHQIYGITETRCFLNLLSALLERNAPKVESPLTHTGTGSRLSSGRWSESRASSAVFSTYSTSSMRVDSAISSSAMLPVDSSADVHNPAAEPAVDPDDISECSDLEAQLNLSTQLQMASMLSFAYIWSLGAFIPFSEHGAFSEFARDQIMQLPFLVPLPEEGSVFDYCLNLKQYQFVPWSQRGGEAANKSTRSSGYVSLPEVERLSYIVDLYLSYGLDVMVVGQPGTGKTSFVENLVQSRLPVTRLQMSPTLIPSQLQDFILERVGHLDKRAGHRLAGGGGGGGRGASRLASSMRTTFFLDDVHLASSGASTDLGGSRVGEEGDCSPVLELARFAVQHHHLPDTTRAYTHSLNNVRYIVSCVPGDYWGLPHQFSRSFNPVPFLPPTDDFLQRVFCRSVLQWLLQFPDTALGGDPQPLAKALSAASVAVYRSVSERFHPSPSTPYLLFTMHDLLRVYEGLLLLSPNAKAQAQPQFGLLNRRGFLSSTQSGKTSKKTSNPKLKNARRGSTILPALKKPGDRGSQRTTRRVSISQPSKSDDDEAVSAMTRMVVRLWCHESTRVYLDKTTDSKDRMWFLKLLEACIKYCFCGIDFKDPQSDSAQKPLQGGGRRVRGGRGRMMQGPASSSSAEGPSLEELVSNGIKADTLKQLMTREREESSEELDGGPGDGTTPKKLIALDQVTLRGEDLTSLIFAHFPSQCSLPTSGGSLSEVRSSTSSEEGAREKTKSPETVDNSTPSLATGTGSYSELGDGQVMETLAKHLAGYHRSDLRDTDRNTESGLGHKMDLVLFKGAIEHAARLCRSMILPGTHSLLIGSKGSGRSSLVRLVSQVLNAKIFILKESGQGLSDATDSLRQQLRDVCMSAAIDERLTVLMINGSVGMSMQGWEDVYKVMNEGLCPGLFTSSELLVMSSKMQAGRIKKTVEGARQTFARAVCRQLHVVILWNIADEQRWSLFGSSTISRRALVEPKFVCDEEFSRLCFASLYRACSYVDVYQPWSKQDYCDIALSWWQRASGDVQWEEWAESSSQLEAVGHLAAHIHITTAELLRRSHSTCVAELVTPRTFVECLKMTQKLATAMKQKERSEANRLRRALEKLSDIDNTVNDLDRQLATLQPQLASAEHEVQQKMNLITAAKERYMAANRRCKSAEETIQRETENMEQLSKMVDEKFSEVSPVYHSALEALTSVKQNDILELMSYREPPELLTPVFHALCMLFDREKTWEDCKQLLLTQNFFESLRFFDRDNVPLFKLRRLERMINRTSKFGEMEHGSQAVVPLCEWLVALVDYHHAKMAVKPYKDRLVDAEKTLMDANKTFVEMKKDMMETKGALESTVKLHKESLRQQRSIEFEITGLKSKLECAKHLLTTTSAQRERWDTNLKVVRGKIESVPGHALLCAASVCYLARTPPDQHQTLLTNWLGYCSGQVNLGSLYVERGGLQPSQEHRGYSSRQQVVQIQKDFSIDSHLSVEDERSYWKQESTFPNRVSRERCLAARSVCTTGGAQWPFIFDPHRQFDNYLRTVHITSTESQHSKGVVPVHAADSATSVKSQGALSHQIELLKIEIFEQNFCQELEKSLQEGNTVMLYVDATKCPDQSEHPLSVADTRFVSKVLAREFIRDDDTKLYKIEKKDSCLITVHPDFQLYLVSNKHLEDVFTSRPGSLGVHRFELNLSDFCVIDGALSLEGMERHLQRFIVTHERPEYRIRYKSLLTDLILHQQQLTDSQESVLKCVLESEDSLLLQATHLLNTVKEAESSEATALEQIADTNKSMLQFDQLALAYKPLSDLASVIFTAVEKLSSVLNYFVFDIDKLERVIERLISERDGYRVCDNVMSINANVLHLKRRLFASVYEILQVSMFRRHQTLLPLMVAMEMQVRKGKMTNQERQLLSCDLAGLEQQLDLVLREESDEIPTWIPRKMWCRVLELESQMEPFKRLSSEISTNSREWKEYFDVTTTPHLLAPIPTYQHSSTLSQKLLLWRTFRPEKLSHIFKDFVVMEVGPEVAPGDQPLSLHHLLPLTSPQVPTLCILPPSSIQDNDYRGRPQPFDLLETAAEELNRRLCSFSLFDEEQWGEFLLELPQLASEDNWLVLEHCHLYSRWREHVEKAAQALGKLSVNDETLHRDFRLWLLLPFDDIHSDHSTETKFLKVAFDCGSIVKDSKLTSALQSLELSNDLQLLYPSQLSGRGQWEDYRPLLSKLQSLVPPALTYSRLTDLNPQQATTQTPLSVLYEELCVHSSALVQLHTSLSNLFTFFNGDTLFTSRTGQILTSIRENIVPAPWKHFLPFPLAQCTELMSVLNLLKRRMEFYERALERGELDTPLIVEPYLLSTPEDIVSRILRNAPCDCQLEMHVDAKLIIGDLSLHQNNDAIVFSDLSLHGARWEESTMQLCPLHDGQDKKTTQHCSLLLTLSRQTAHSSDSASCPQPGTSAARMYNCPLLLLSSGAALEASVNSAPLLCSIQLPCSCEWVEPSATAILMTTHQTPCERDTTPTQPLVGCNWLPSVFLSCELPT